MPFTRSFLSSGTVDDHLDRLTRSPELEFLLEDVEALAGFEVVRKGADSREAGLCGQALELSTSRVTRGLVLLELDEFGEFHTVRVEAQIALARCPRCGTRPRVLPYDVLPRKLYALTVIVELSAT